MMPAQHLASSPSSAPASIVVMGVAGCGKSTFGKALTRVCGLPYIEGDHFHAATSLEKMKSGYALDDIDRDVWLSCLEDQLRQHAQGAVVTCSALKRAYRQRLRMACPALRFIYLDISQPEASARVASRAGHIFPAKLLQSQFAILESPEAEDGVLKLPATALLTDNVQQALAWLYAESVG
jgi:gluconokinase